MEGHIEFRALMSKSLLRIISLLRDKKRNIKLYDRRVSIMKYCDELTPEWLNFVKGVAGSEDSPLNISKSLYSRTKPCTLSRWTLRRSDWNFCRNCRDEG